MFKAQENKVGGTVEFNRNLLVSVSRNLSQDAVQVITEKEASVLLTYLFGHYNPLRITT